MKRIKKFFPNLPDEAVYDRIDSPVGFLLLFASTEGIYSISWEKEANLEECKQALNRYRCDPNQAMIVKVKKQLNEYFSGVRRAFDVPFCLEGTPFQIKAWQALREIPYGETISYGEQAARLGDKNKARAVGLANGLNPISIIIPCHRVIGSNGQLTGFGGGLENKARLLKLEKAIL